MCLSCECGGIYLPSHTCNTIMVCGTPYTPCIVGMEVLGLVIRLTLLGARSCLCTLILGHYQGTGLAMLGAQIARSFGAPLFPAFLFGYTSYVTRETCCTIHVLRTSTAWLRTEERASVLWIPHWIPHWRAIFWTDESVRVSV